MFSCLFVFSFTSKILHIQTCHKHLKSTKWDFASLSGTPYQKYTMVHLYLNTADKQIEGLRQKQDLFYERSGAKMDLQLMYLPIALILQTIEKLII